MLRSSAEVDSEDPSPRLKCIFCPLRPNATLLFMTQLFTWTRLKGA